MSEVNKKEKIEQKDYEILKRYEKEIETIRPILYPKRTFKYRSKIILRKKVRIEGLKKKFNRFIVVSNEIDVKKDEEWDKTLFEKGTIGHLRANLSLLYPIEKLPIFELTK